MKIKKTRLWVGIACIVLSAIISFIALPFAIKSAADTEKVLVAKTDIFKGDRFTNDNCEFVSMGKVNMPVEAVRDAKEIDKMYASMTISKGGLILKTNLTESTGEGYSLTNLPKGKVAITVSLKGVSSTFANQLRPGDIVQVNTYQMGTTSDGRKVSRVVKNPMFQYLELYTLNTDSGGTINKPSGDAKYSIATLIVTPEQAAELIRLEYEGGIYLTLIYRGERQIVDEYVAKQDEFLKKMKEGK